MSSVERAKYWRAEGLEGLELLKARYVTHQFVPHTHDGFVIGVIDAGVETFHYRGEQHYALRDHLLLVNPDEVHTGSAGDNNGWMYRTLYPHVTQLERIAQDAFGWQQTPYFTQAVAYDPEMAQALRQCHRALEHPTSKLEQDSSFFALIAMLLKRYAEGSHTAPRKKHHPKIAQARAYLNAYAENDIRLVALSELVDLSPAHFLRVFKRETGLTPHAYQIVKRIAAAKTLLNQGKGVAQVATETGFYDQSHFGKHFKRLVGVSPGRYGKTLGSTNNF